MQIEVSYMHKEKIMYVM